MSKDRAFQLLPARTGETDDQRRLREAINRLGGQMMGTLDAAISLRTAAPDAQQARHVARAKLREFGLHAALAMDLAQPDP